MLATILREGPRKWCGKLWGMNYYGAKELADSFRTVRKNTITIAEQIGEEHYGFRAAPDTRTVAQMLVHIAVSTKMAEQIQVVERRKTLEGFDFPAFLAQMIAAEQTARKKAEIVNLLRTEGEHVARWLENFPEEALAERVQLPAGVTPPSKSRFEMLLSIKEHEMHHRGQLMLIERMIGIVPHTTRQMQERIAAMQSAKASV